MLHTLALLFACRPPVAAVVLPVAEPIGPSRLSLPAGADASTPVFFSAASGELLMSWQEPGRVLFSRRSGGQWSAPSVIAEGEALMSNWADFPSVVAGDDGLIAHWLQQQGDSPYAYGVQLARSTDDGQTWTPLGTPHDDSPTEHGFASLLPVGDHVRLFWLDGRGMMEEGPMTLRTATITDGVIGEQEILDERVCDCCGTSAALIDGLPAILYRDRSLDEQRDIGLVQLGDGAWEAPVVVADDGWIIPGCPVNGPALAAASTQPVAAWFTAARQSPQVRVSFARDVPRIVAAGESVLGRVDLLLEDDDTVLVSWMASTSEDTADILIRRVHRDGRMGEPLILGHTAASRASGFPQLAWHDDELVAAWTVPGEPAVIEAVTLETGAIPPLSNADTVVRAGITVSKRLPELPPDLRGEAVVRDPDRPVLLNLWATWCAPCREELPDLVDIQARHPELQVLAVSVDDPALAEQVQAMAAQQAKGLTVLHGSGDAPARALGVTILPTTLLFDADGTLLWSAEGRLDPDALEAVLSR